MCGLRITTAALHSTSGQYDLSGSLEIRKSSRIRSMVCFRRMATNCFGSRDMDQSEGERKVVEDTGSSVRSGDKFWSSKNME